jgi:hypothetical protein
LDEVVGDQRSPVVKQALSETGFEVDWEPSQIPVDRLAYDLWYDPRVAGAMPAATLAATDGLAESAWLHRARTQGHEPGSPRLVRPRDVAGMARAPR